MTQPHTFVLDGFPLTGVDEYGVEWTVARAAGWHDAAEMRTARQPKAQQAGTWAASGHPDERYVIFTGLASAPDTPTLEGAARRLAAVLASGGMGDLTGTSEYGSLSASVSMEVAPRSTPLTAKLAAYSLTVAAPDPLLYGPPTYGSASLASATPGTVRTNLCTNPALGVNATGWNTIAGTRVAQGAGWAWRVDGSVISYLPGAPAVGTSGQFWSGSIVLSGPAGNTANVGIYDGAGFITPLVPVVMTGAPQTVAMTSITPATGTVPQALLYPSGTWAAGQMLTATNALLEQVSGVGVAAGIYFDGDTPDTADTDYAWTGTANASTSTARSGPGRKWPRVWPTDYGVPEGVTPGAVLVPNAGTAAYWPRLRIDGPVLNPVVTFLETGAWVRFNGSLAAGQWLDWDMANRRVLLQGQVSVRLPVSSSGNWLAVPVGGGSVVWTADTADPAALLSVWGYERAVS